MKTINLFILCVFLFSCEKDTNPAGKKENQPDYEIYYRWTEYIDDVPFDADQFILS